MKEVSIGAAKPPLWNKKAVRALSKVKRDFWDATQRVGRPHALILWAEFGVGCASMAWTMSAAIRLIKPPKQFSGNQKPIPVTLFSTPNGKIE